MPDVGLGTERVWPGRGRRARCESGEGGEIEITRERASEAATYSVSERGARAACNGALTSTAPPLLTSFRPSCQDTLTASLHRRMKSCLRSAHSLARGIRTIPEVEPRHGGGLSLQSSVFQNLLGEARRKSLEHAEMPISNMNSFGSRGFHTSCFTLCSKRATHRAAYEQLRSRGRST